jgi:hypothetical protein
MEITTTCPGRAAGTAVGAEPIGATGPHEAAAARSAHAAGNLKWVKSLGGTGITGALHGDLEIAARLREVSVHGPGQPYPGAGGLFASAPE